MFASDLLDTYSGRRPPRLAPWPTDRDHIRPERDGADDLRRGVDTLAAEDLDHLSDPALGDQILALLREKSRLEAQISRRVARADHRGVALGDGAASLGAWLRERAGLGAGEAHALVRGAAALEEMPTTCDAYEAGEIGTTRMRMLASARAPGYEEPFAAVEGSLVEVARVGTLRDLRHALSYWRSHLDRDGGAEAALRLHERRGLWASRTLDGSVAVRGDLDPEGGELLLAALAAHSPTPAADDTRSPAQRRADTLTDLCRLALDGKLPGGATRPHISVVIDAGTLADAATTMNGHNAPTSALAADAPTAGLADPAEPATRPFAADAHGGSTRVCELGYLGPIVPAAAIRIACDAAITRVVLGPDGRLLDLGRTTRVPPANLRRALEAHDRGCRFPGCDRPLAWCHLHHVIHWLHGGDTAHQNLVHVCGHHHHLLHEGGWTATFDGTDLAVFRPDGTLLAGPAGPAGTSAVGHVGPVTPRAP